jgi:hypothetical protein
MTAHRLRRLQMCGGLLCFGLGAVGAVVPLLPTTVFVLGGSYLLARSAPGLNERLLSSSWFRSCLPYLDPTVPLARRARIMALLAMWASITVSALITLQSGVGGPRVVTALLIVGGIGTVSLLLFRRERGA